MEEIEKENVKNKESSMQVLEDGLICSVWKVQPSPDTVTGSQLSSAVLAGFLSDTFGRRPLLLIGSTSIVITRYLLGSSQTYMMIWLVGVIEGVMYVAFLS